MIKKNTMLIAALLTAFAVLCQGGVESVIIQLQPGSSSHTYTVPDGKVLLIRHMYRDDTLGAHLWLEKDGAVTVFIEGFKFPTHLDVEVPSGWTLRTFPDNDPRMVVHIFGRLLDVSDGANPLQHSLSNVSVRQGRLTASVTMASPNPATIAVETSDDLGEGWRPAEDATVIASADNRSHEVSVPVSRERALIRTQAKPVE